MNNRHQAQNGFKTFVLTLLISLGVFGVVYYITSYPTHTIDIDEHTRSEETLGYEDSSPFAELNREDSSVPRRDVLAEMEGPENEEALGEDLHQEEQTAEEETVTATGEATPVPDTGVAGLTISLFASLLVLAAGLTYIYLGPRSLALKSFEDDILS